MNKSNQLICNHHRNKKCFRKKLVWFTFFTVRYFVIFSLKNFLILPINRQNKTRNRSKNPSSTKSIGRAKTQKYIPQNHLKIFERNTFIKSRCNMHVLATGSYMFGYLLVAPTLCLNWTTNKLNICVYIYLYHLWLPYIFLKAVSVLFTPFIIIRVCLPERKID